MLKILNQIFLVPWSKLEPGMSVFIPCLDRNKHREELLAEATRLGLDVVCKAVIENGKMGLRLWRVK